MPAVVAANAMACRTQQSRLKVTGTFSPLSQPIKAIRAVAYRCAAQRSCPHAHASGQSRYSAAAAACGLWRCESRRAHKPLFPRGNLHRFLEDLVLEGLLAQAALQLIGRLQEDPRARD